jgi:GNAT superfamily N-acetyltransferase
VSLSPPEPLSPDHDVTGFDCGKPALNDWIRSLALKNQQHGFSMVMVVHDAKRVVGYYGLAPSGVVTAGIPRSIRTGRRPQPLPVILLGQLAVDRGWSGRGLGAGLLKHALVRCVAAARLIGGRAVLVNALDDEAEKFWKGRGFVAAKNDSCTLFRSIKDIEASLAASGLAIPEFPAS